MKTVLQENIGKTFKKLNTSLSSFSESELNTVPFEGSWTAAQVIRHLILGCSGYPEMFAGKTEKTTREPDEKIKDIETLFYNFELKMQAADFLTPANIEYNQNSLTLSLLKIEEELLNTSETADLTLTYLDFELPGFGKFTFYEWINFALIHITRHLRQLDAISKIVIKQ